MSLYIAGRATQLGVGEQINLTPASLGVAPYKTAAVAIGRDASGFDAVCLFNKSGVTATIEVSPTDDDADFIALTDSDTNQAITVANNVAGCFRCIGPFARLSFVSDPGAGVTAIFAR